MQIGVDVVFKGFCAVSMHGNYLVLLGFHSIHIPCLKHVTETVPPFMTCSDLSDICTIILMQHEIS